MNDTRQIAQRYMDRLCAGEFAAAFDLLSEHATYQIIGTTAISSPMQGRAAVQATLVPAIASFQKPLKLQFSGLIVDGNRAVGLASGAGVGPSGKPYAQAHYAMVLTIDNGEIQNVLEFMDTVAVEVALFDKKLVAA